MDTRTIITLLVFSALSCNSFSEEQGVQAQIDEARTQIKQEEAKKEQLNSEITSRENEVAELRKRLEELENKTTNND